MILKQGINDVFLKQAVTKFLASEGEKLTYIYERLLKAHGEAAVIMSTFWWWEDWLKKLKQEEQYLITNHGVAVVA